MIVGIGTDICDIRRIGRSIDRFGEKFLKRIFTQAERDYCNAKSEPVGYYAKRFAAKEAAAKALSGANTGHLSWQDVEIANNPSGRPVLNLYNNAKKRAESLIPDGARPKLHLSLSDDYPYAQAFVIFESLET